MSSAARPALAGLTVADAPGDWADLGFTVEGTTVQVGTVAIELVGTERGKGLLGWTLRDTPAGDLDGLPTARTEAPPAPGGEHANGALAIDHVVVFTPDRARTSAVLDAAGLGLRRVRTSTTPPAAPDRPVEQAFHRAGEVIVEVVGPPVASGDGPATLWGLVCVVPDVDALAATLGNRLGDVRDAVQPGRRIATVRRSAGLATPLAFINLQT